MAGSSFWRVKNAPWALYILLMFTGAFNVVLHLIGFVRARWRSAFKYALEEECEKADREAGVPSASQAAGPPFPEGQISISDSMIGRFIHSCCQPRGSGAGLAPSLSICEEQTVWLLCSGKRDKEIAERMNKAPETVHAFLKRAFKKLGVHKRSEAAATYLQWKISGFGKYRKGIN